jgi:RNA polymerase sigma factor (sigma-70 family)
MRWSALIPPMDREERLAYFERLARARRDFLRTAIEHPQALREIEAILAEKGGEEREGPASLPLQKWRTLVERWQTTFDETARERVAEAMISSLAPLFQSAAMLSRLNDAIQYPRHRLEILKKEAVQVFASERGVSESEAERTLMAHWGDPYPPDSTNALSAVWKGFRELASETGIGLRDIERIAAEAGRSLTAFKKAMERLIQGNTRLALTYALGYVGNGVPLEDLVQEAMLALSKAIEKFDTSRGAAFSTYAVFWLRFYLQQAIVRQGDGMQWPQDYVDLKIALEKAASRAAHKLGREPKLAEVLSELGKKVDRDLASRLLRSRRETISMNEKASVEDGEYVLSDTLPHEEFGEVPTIVGAHDHPNDPLAILERSEEIEEVRKVLEMMTPRHARILLDRVGVNDKKVGGVSIGTLRAFGKAAAAFVDAAKSLGSLRDWVDESVESGDENAVVMEDWISEKERKPLSEAEQMAFPW